MPGKRARSRDQTSFGTAGTPEALRSPPMGFPGTPPSAIVQPVPEFIWEMSVKVSCVAIATDPTLAEGPRAMQEQDSFLVGIPWKSREHRRKRRPASPFGPSPSYLHVDRLLAFTSVPWSCAIG